jgi:DNA polymerase-2
VRGTLLYQRSVGEAMKAFVVHATYRVEGKNAYVYLYGRQEDGKTFLTKNKSKPYFFIRKSDEEQARFALQQQNLPGKITKSTRKSFSEKPLSLVTLTDPKDVPSVRDALDAIGIQTYEADVRFAVRFLMDNNIQGSVDITGTPAQHAHVDCFYEEPTFTPVRWTPTLRVLALDIETGNKGATLYCVSLVTNDGTSEVHIVSEEPVAGTNVFSYPTEKACLEAFCQRVRAIDPDVVTGWSVVDYDLARLSELCEKHGVPFMLGRADEKTRMRLDNSMFRDSTADIVGRQVLDGIMLLKASFVKLDDYKLGTAAHEILGKEKLIDGPNKLAAIEESYRNDKANLAEYCRLDSQLVLDILAKKRVLDLAIERSLLTGLPMDRTRASIASLDSLYLRELTKRGIAARTHTYQEKEEQITGGYVMESVPGIFDYVIVCDFKSLYPSIMRTLNIDPLSFVADKRLPHSTDELILAENGAVFRNTTGILPAILDTFHEARNEAKARKDPVAIGAIKVLMNSFFGSLASPQCRFFSLEVANAITVTGQHLIKTTAERIRSRGYEVIYGDTDSLFIDLNVSSLEEAERIGRDIEQDINAFFTEYTKERYRRDSKLELQFEKTFVRFYLPLTRGGESSKKRYAGLRIIDGKEQIDFTGLEFVRRDWTELAKEFQLGILDRVFHHKPVVEYVKQFVTDLKEGKLDALLVYKKALRKDIDEYTKTTPQHVKAAMQLDEITSRIIEYVITEEGPQPLEKKTSPIDYQHYIDKQLRPLADQVLFFERTNFDDVISGTSQKSLFEY